jgi:hypothetical protein
MSVVTTLSVVLFVGLIATGLVGFLGWRHRMREGAAVSEHQPQTLSRSTR